MSSHDASSRVLAPPLPVEADDFDTRALSRFPPAALYDAVHKCPKPILITDPVGVIRFANPAFCDQSGYRLDAISGRRPRMFRSDKTPHALYRSLWDTILSGERWQGELCNRRGNGELYWVAETIHPILGPDGCLAYFVADTSEIADPEASPRKRWCRERIDQLTGLPNRSAFLLQLDAALQAALWPQQELALVYLDIDHFTDINHVYGHLTGDALIRSLARRLRKSLRDTDVLGRIDGDDFAFFLRDADAAGSLWAVEQRIAATFMRPFLLSETLEVQLSCSIGISRPGPGPLDPETLLKRAMAAMISNRHLIR